MSSTKYSISPIAPFLSAWRQRALLWQLTRRDVVGRYRGSMMGLLWSFLNPLLMLAVYTFVFSEVFPARWGQGNAGKTDFAILLFAGMIVHALFAECVNRAPNLILSHPGYVKKVVFPLEILPWMALASTLFHAAISVLVLLLFFAAVHAHIHWTAVYLPAVLLPLALLTIGFSWFLASVGVFLRDVGQTTGFVTTAMMFLSPVFYPASALPEGYRRLLHLNPLTFIIEQSRDVLVWGKTPDWQGLAVYFAVSMVVGWLGFFWFQKTRKGFADVL